MSRATGIVLKVLAALVVANARPDADTPELREAVAGWIAVLEQPDGPRKRLAATWPNLVTERFRQSEAGRAAFQAWEAVLAQLPGTSLGNVARGMTSFNVAASLGRVEAPTLVISGSEDRLIAPAQSRRTSDLVAGAQFHLIDGAGHISNLDSPAGFNAALLSFLQRVSS